MAPGTSSKRPRVLPGQTRLPVERPPKRVKPAMRVKSKVSRKGAIAKAAGQPTLHAALAYHDASTRGSRALQVPDVVGSFVTLPTVSRSELSTSTSGAVKYLIVQWTPSHRRGIVVEQSGSNWSYASEFNLSHLLDANPTSIRPLAMTVKIRNSSQADTLQGVIRVLQMSEPLEWEFNTGLTGIVSNAFKEELDGMLNGHPSVKTYTGASFASGKKFIMHPTTMVEYKSYKQFDNSSGFNNLATLLAESGLANPMSITIFQFPSTTVQQKYDLSIHAIDAGRFPSNVLYSNLAEQPRPVNSAQFQSGVNIQQQHAGTAVPDVQMGGSS